MLSKIRFFLVASTIAVSAVPSSAADLAEAVAQLEKWQQRIVTIRVRSRTTSTAETNASIRGANCNVGVTERDWIWEDSGRFRDESTTWNDDRVVDRSLRTADVMRYYSFGGRAGDGEHGFRSSVAIHENSLLVTSMKLLSQPFRVLWDDGTRTWLGDRLKNVPSGVVNDEGFLEIAGDAVEMPGVRVWLDPQHGYLPQRVKYPLESHTRYSVDEFQEVQPGFWFPRRGRILAIVDNEQYLQTWEVTKVELNREFPAELFTPPLADGTYVVNSITGQQYWHGGKPPRRAGTAAAPSTESAPANPYPLTAVPEQARNWSLWLVLAGILSVALGVWVRRRS